MTTTEIMAPYAEPSTTYYRRGTVFVTGERTWAGERSAPLGVRRVIDARGVVWERRAGWWRRFDGDDQSHMTWRQLIAQCGQLTEVVDVRSDAGTLDGEP